MQRPSMRHGRSPDAKVWTITEPDAPIRQAMGRLSVETWSRSFHEITRDIAGWLTEIGAADGILAIFLRHTSASLVIQENADADVRRDLLDALDRLAPQDAGYRHATEGPDDMPAHIKAAITGAGLTVPVIEGALDLGTWQGIFVAEHRASNHSRTVTLAFQGSFRTS